MIADAVGHPPDPRSSRARRGRAPATRPNGSWPSTTGHCPSRLTPAVLPFDAARLRRARRVAAEHAERAGLAAERVDDVLLAVGEMAANSLRHGGGSGVLRLWTDADHVVCEVADAGVIDDPLAAVARPPRASSAGAAC